MQRQLHALRVHAESIGLPQTKLNVLRAILDADETDIETIQDTLAGLARRGAEKRHQERANPSSAFRLPAPVSLHPNIGAVGSA